MGVPGWGETSKWIEPMKVGFRAEGGERDDGARPLPSPMGPVSINQSINQFSSELTKKKEERTHNKTKLVTP